MDGPVAIGGGVELFVRPGAQSLTGNQLKRVHEATVGVRDLRTNGVVHGIVNHTLGVLDGNGHCQSSDRRRIGKDKGFVVVPAGEAVVDRSSNSATAGAAATGRRTR